MGHKLDVAVIVFDVPVVPLVLKRDEAIFQFLLGSQLFLSVQDLLVTKHMAVFARHARLKLKADRALHRPAHRWRAHRARANKRSQECCCRLAGNHGIGYRIGVALV